MSSLTFSVFGLSTPVLKEGDSIVSACADALKDTPAKEFMEGDILVLAESPLAVTEGRTVHLASVTPSPAAKELAEKYQIDAALAEVVLSESDEIVGGVPGYLLAKSGNLFLPNAGIDESNAPEGYVTLLPKNPDESAKRVRDEIRAKFGCDTAVLVIDSRTHAMRLGVSGVAIGVSGLRAITDERGKSDLFGHTLHVTRRAIGDDLASTAELLMGESNERVPAVLIRGYPYQHTEDEGIASIAPEEDLFLGMMRK